MAERFYMKHCLIIFALLLVATVAARAGEIRGRVSNAQGASVAGTKVTATNQKEGARWEATTGSDGTYALEGLEPGVYTLTIAGASGQEALRRQVVLGPESGTARADFQLAPAAAQTVSAAEERNPNIFVYRIDLNELRNRLTVGRGADPQYIPEFRPEQNYFGAEFGASLLNFEVIRSRSLLSSWRGSVSALHQNSALNARNFFNVGPLRASRLNSYSLTGSGPLASEKASLLVQYGQSFTSGFVNGNILVPDLSERTPRSPDPRVNAVIASLLKAYPAEAPNLGDGRLNSNATRDIDATDALARLDLKPSEGAAVALRYTVNDYVEEPFQLVAGQNPQTNLRNQSVHSSLTETFSPQTVGRFGFHYDRPAALLEPTQRFKDLLAPLGISPVPDIEISSEAAGIGPGPKFPRRRVQNRFQFYSDLSHSAGRHALKAGWSTTRVQLNDLQSDNSRGTLVFDRNFGLSSLQNFLLGTPTQYTIAFGNLYRGFRNWEHFLFAEDQIRIAPTLSVSLGLRYELMTAPVEVNRLTEVGFPTDKNNFAPRFGFAWNPGRRNTTIRGAYGISYSTIFPVTFGMTRFNPPATQVVQVFNPDLLNSLAGSTAQQSRSSLYRLNPDLVMPYSHQYSFGIERSLPGGATLRIGYIGMRSFHILTLGEYNRARPVPGIPITTATIDARRPDPRYSNINVVESNSISYFDAMQLSVDKRLTRGLTFRASYTVGKSIDTGGDFTNTASGVENPPEQGTPSCEQCARFSDQKGLSLFDTPQVFVLSYSYALPFPARVNGWTSALFSGWQISGTTIFQSGTAFHMHTGSDNPGIGNVDGVSHDRPNIGNPAILGRSLDDPNTSVAVLQSGRFDTNLPPGGRGNIGYNTFRKDGTNNWNFALGRTFRLPGGRERSLQFRTEFINLLNHAQFEKPQIQFASRTFGQITNTANKGRQVQFLLRLNF